MSDATFLDEAMAECIIDRSEDVPSDLQGLVAVIEELRETPVPSGGDDVVLAMLAARQRSMARSRRLRMRTQSSLVAALAVAVGLAAAGDLPAVAQSAIHALLGDVGIHVPYHVRHPQAQSGGYRTGTPAIGIGTTGASGSGYSQRLRGNPAVTKASSPALKDVAQPPAGPGAFFSSLAEGPRGQSSRSESLASPSESGAKGSRSSALEASEAGLPASGNSATAVGHSRSQRGDVGDQPSYFGSTPSLPAKGKPSK
jgi:hypothetical protein